MRAAIFERFQGPITVTTLPDPAPRPGGVVLKVGATGLCRSDWHGWMGHDTDICLPHVPGHELAGTVVAVGAGVTRWAEGDRVTVPFVGGCGHCGECAAGQHQVCENQFQPGFTHWGSFADHVAIDHADVNLVALPEEMGFDVAASLGCRFVTSFRGVIDQGRVRAGEWVAVHGCGGVGLSAVMIAAAAGAQVIAIDIDPAKLDLARSLGAVATIDATTTANGDVPGQVHEITRGGVQLSIDALGHPMTCVNSVLSLRRRGRHVQIGLLLADQARPAIPMDRVIAWELELLGSHGMQAHRYPAMLEMIRRGRLQPERLIGARVDLDEGTRLLTMMDRFPGTGVTIIDRFEIA
ncbi:zinc-dependent alcohol dehydrogenase family protein [Tistrella mobilis]|uniref:Alcohol dehydrogenase GroES domain protein n=1 Tax=Tistrella mobilis (strain KA081020-065) TaxID=1110502 RepID=I3TSA9_TISMK|nr:zinc-dependent alcohol dehydrogenase family protein [Tistrella mobilis]AFK55647.1 Alcohol dehydrogenase GroES domain protein [Tistrella mobilis KA081020-065]